MNQITLYRRDFRDHMDDRESLFNDVLRSVNVDFDGDINDIEEITLCYDSVIDVAT